MHPEEAALRRRFDEIEARHPNLPFDMQEFRDKLNALMATVLVPTGERYRHEKRGTVYDIYGFGHANSANEFFVSSNANAMGGGPIKKVIFDRDEVVIYRDVQSGHIGVRTITEFADGRFTLLPQRTGRPPVEHPQTVAAALGQPAPSAPRPLRKDPALSAPYGNENKRVKFRQYGHLMHGKTGTVLEWLDQGKVRVKFDGNESPVVVPSLNIVPHSDDEAVQG